MVLMISELWSRSSFNPIPTHVYRQQDNSKRKTSRLEKLSCKIDLIAKYIATKQIAEKITCQRTPFSLGIGTITCCGELVTSMIQQTLYNAILHERLINWYTKYYNIPHELIKTEVSWKIFQ